jgi:hypothetical protein
MSPKWVPKLCSACPCPYSTGARPVHSWGEAAEMLLEADGSSGGGGGGVLKPGGSDAVFEDSVRGGGESTGGSGRKASGASVGAGEEKAGAVDGSTAAAAAPSSVGAGKMLKGLAGGSLKGGLGWGAGSGRRRHGGAHVRELIRLGPLVWASCDDGVLEAWDAETGECAALSPHRDLGGAVQVESSIPIP